MSEDLIQSAAHPIGRYAYVRLGSTNLKNLKKSKYIRGGLTAAEESRKPDGIVFLPKGGIKAVVEVKQTKEIVGKKLAAVVKKYSPIARAVCNILIVTDGKTSYWYNPHTEKPILSESGSNVGELFAPKAVEGRTLKPEVARKISALIEQASLSISKDNNKLSPLHILDPSGLTKTVWQKIWINTGKDPGKCLYNVVEIFLFKFLSDIGVLDGNYCFQRVIDLIVSGGSEDALIHYSNISRTRIRALFPPGKDGTTVINGTIFVNEKGKPNLAQANLFAEVIVEFQLFDDIHGSMRHIDREFKTRLYETFLRQEAGVKSLGQYFTPRNVVRAMVEMSCASTLRDGARICDPFCGVGGFVLETIVGNKNIWDQFKPDNGRVAPKITIKGYDKGSDEKDDERTIILAKANMLIYFSELLSEYNSKDYLEEFSTSAFNAVFELIRTNLGTFGRHDDLPYDLILTNPPYVTKGATSLKGAIDANGLSDKFSPIGRGTEALAIQWIIQNLKPNGEALVVVPDGLLNQKPILNYIKEACFIRGIVALPVRTFYSTPKKTHILVLNKKPHPLDEQTEPVFTYIVSEIGESRNTRRVAIEQNDLDEMVPLFQQFNANRSRLKTKDKRCKLIDFETIHSADQWAIDKWWTKKEKIALGIEEEDTYIKYTELPSLVEDIADNIMGFRDLILALKDKADYEFKEILIGDLFEFPSIKGVTKEFTEKHKGTIPVYGGKTYAEPIGYIAAKLPNVKYFNNCLAWNRNGTAGHVFLHNHVFTTTDDHRPMSLKEEYEDTVSLEYARLAIENVLLKIFSWNDKAGKEKVAKLSIPIPITSTGDFDTNAQEEIVAKNNTITDLKDAVNKELEKIKGSFVSIFD